MNLKKIIAGAKGSEGGIYRTASIKTMLFACATSGGKNVFMMLMMYAGYMANAGYGVLLTVTGIITMVKTIFDGVCDPFVAAIFDRMPVGKLGKIRKFLLIGYSCTIVCAILMFNLLANKFTGVAGIVVFCVVYFLFVIGYTILSIGGTTIPTIVTNDPKQRPFMNFTATVYQYLSPLILNSIMAFAILPRHNQQYDAACLGEACFIYSAVAVVFMLVSFIGVAPVDNEQVLGELMSMSGKNKKVGFKEMWDMLKVNKPLRCYVATGTSDKLANKMSTDQITTVLLTGILIGNYQATTMINNAGMIIGLMFAFIGGIFIAKYGVKTSTVVWSWFNIGISAALFVLCVVLGPWGMSKIGAFGVPMILYVALMMGKNAGAMILNTAEGMMRADIADYELDRSGNFMPGMVGACYTFIEKTVASLGSVITTLAVGLIGYTATAPQMGDKPSIPLFFLTMLLVYGMPVIGWLCNIVAMKFYEAGHPVPDENSFRGTEAVLELTHDLLPTDTVLFLLSGGGSALFEKPLIPAEELQDITKQLLACGADIVEMNTVRKRLSGVKGGRFALHCAPAKVETVVLSDILGDPLDMIASGPAAADPSTAEQARAIAEKYALRLSEAAWSCLGKETPKALDNVHTQIIGSVRELCRAAAERCRALGYDPILLTDRLDCEAREAGRFLAAVLGAHAGEGKKLAFLAGGETVVHLTGPGLGGRNQELALAAASGMAGLSHAAVISVGSDGTDGPTDAAGGYVDGDTLAALKAAGLNVHEVLADNDAYHALEAVGGLIKTGPTGTNVNDVSIGLVGEA